MADLTEQFVRATKASPYLAAQYLNRNNNDLTRAIREYEEHTAAHPAPSQKAKPKHRTGITTFGDLGSDSEPEQDPTHNNFFNGGKTSSLQVEDPAKKGDAPAYVDDIMRRALEQLEEQVDRPPNRTPTPVNRYFTGFGNKLGDGTEPEPVPAADGGPASGEPAANVPEKTTRKLTFWKQGFQIGDGPLHRYDDTGNTEVLRELARGRVPMSILNVDFGQDVDVQVHRRDHEDFQYPKPPPPAFFGGGNRLGSPVPGESATPEPRPPTPTFEERFSIVNVPPVPESDCAIHCRLINGKRVYAMFPLTSSTSVMYEHIRLHPDNLAGSAFTLNLAFPNEIVPDSEDLTVEAAGLRRAMLFQVRK